MRRHDNRAALPAASGQVPSPTAADGPEAHDARPARATPNPRRLPHPDPRTRDSREGLRPRGVTAGDPWTAGSGRPSSALGKPALWTP